jgi:hypothetical protein
MLPSGWRGGCADHADDIAAGGDHFLSAQPQHIAPPPLDRITRLN